MIRDLSAAVRESLAEAEPILVFLAGPNGAGKSTFFRDYLRPLGLPFVNADEIARELREAAPSGMEELDAIAFEKAEELRGAMVSGRISFCTETVFSDPQGAKLAFLSRARAAGFRVFLVFIGISDPELSIARVMQRVEEGGHDVPDDRLRGRYPRTMANLRAAISVVDEAFLFDNSSDREPFRAVAIFSEGQLVDSIDPVPAWATGLPGFSPDEG